MSFLRNFSTSVGMLVGPTDLVESSEDIMRAISSLSVGLKKENLEFCYSESLKNVYENI